MKTAKYKRIVLKLSGESLAGDVGDFGFSGEQIAIGAFRGTPDSAANLVELCEPESLGMGDDEAVCRGNIDTRFDNRRA